MGDIQIQNVSPGGDVSQYGKWSVFGYVDNMENIAPWGGGNCNPSNSTNTGMEVKVTVTLKDNGGSTIGTKSDTICCPYGYGAPDTYWGFEFSVPDSVEQVQATIKADQTNGGGADTLTTDWYSNPNYSSGGGSGGSGGDTTTNSSTLEVTSINVTPIDPTAASVKVTYKNVVTSGSGEQLGVDLRIKSDGSEIYREINDIYPGAEKTFSDQIREFTEGESHNVCAEISEL